MASGDLDGSEMAMDEDDKTFFLSFFLSQSDLFYLLLEGVEN
jgi:hypothetical protein